jgi:hypothetical protein
MSEVIGLGGADADWRWMGIRRHQILLVLLAISAVGDWVIHPGHPFVEVAVGVVLFLMAPPLSDGLTFAQFTVTGLEFWCRSRLTSVKVQMADDTVTIHARGRVVVRGYELRHRGRLDLSGRDVRVATALASLVDGLAASESSRHVSIHVRSTPDGATTLLTLPVGTGPPEGWLMDNALVRDTVTSDQRLESWLLERWRYVRTDQGLVRVLRVCDFSSVTTGTVLLERLQQLSGQVDLSLHFDVIARSRGHRMAERAVHRHSSDATVANAAGFRKSARSVRCAQRLGQREALISGGRALLRIAVFVSVRAPSLGQLRLGVDDVLREFQATGLRCERGLGRQVRWYCFQLPGGPGW